MGIGKRLLVVAAVIILADVALLDRWQLRGRVVDADTGRGIADGWVIADFVGSKPLVNLPIPPHPNHRTETCMGQRIIKTDASGRFYINYFTTNRALAAKGATWRTFRGGYISDSSGSVIRSSLLALPPKSTKLLSKAGSGDRFIAQGTEYLIARRLPALELSASRELLGSLHFASALGCGSSYTAPHIDAVHYAISIAQTFNERMRVRATCREIRDQIAIADRGQPWPFDCDNLPFKYEPSPEVLAVEAEIKAMEARPR